MDQFPAIFRIKESSQEGFDILVDERGFEYGLEPRPLSDIHVQVFRCVKHTPYCRGRIHVRDLVEHDVIGSFRRGKFITEGHNHNPTHESVGNNK